jgi:hypothetical protein
MTSARTVRGRQTEQAFADWFAEHGWPSAERAPASLKGIDVLGMPGWAPEIKARRELNLPAWLRQAETRQGIPFVGHRPDGFGLRTVHLWPVTFRLQDITPLMQHYTFCSTGSNDSHDVSLES